MNGFYRKEINKSFSDVSCCNIFRKHSLRISKRRFYEESRASMEFLHHTSESLTGNIVSLFVSIVCEIVIYFPALWCHPADILEVSTKNCPWERNEIQRSNPRLGLKFCGTKSGDKRELVRRSLSLSLSLSFFLSLHLVF